MGSLRIITGMWAVDDTRTIVCEWLFTIRVSEQAVVLFLDSAIANALERRLYLCGLRSKRIIEGVWRVRVLSQPDIFARSL